MIGFLPIFIINFSLTDAQALSLVEPQKDVCPNEVVVLTCFVPAATIRWKIAAFNVDTYLNTNTDPVGTTRTTGLFTAIVLSSSLSPPSMNSSLSFIGNSTLNDVVVECFDGGSGIATNLTLNFTDAVLPSVPVNPDVTILNCTSMNITWDPPTNTGGDGITITSYTITIYPLPTSLYSSCIDGMCNTTDQYYILTGLQYGTQYNIYISANNCVGNGNSTTFMKHLIYDPFNISLIPLDTSVSSCNSAMLSWKPPSIDTVLINYHINISSPSYTLTVNTSNTSLYVSNISCTTDYIISIQTVLCNETVSKPNISTVSFSKPPPSSPTDVSVVPLNCTAVQLQWTSPTSDYTITYHISSTAIGSPIYTTNETSLIINELDLDTVPGYNFTVSGSVCDCIEQSNTVSILQPKLVPHPTVNNLRIINCNDSNTRQLVWNISSNDTELYSIAITPPPLTECQCTSGNCNTSMTSININCLQFGTNYTIGVAPINKCDKLMTPYQYLSCKPIADVFYTGAIVGSIIGGLLVVICIVIIVVIFSYWIIKTKIKKFDNEKETNRAQDVVIYDEINDKETREKDVHITSNVCYQVTHPVATGGVYENVVSSTGINTTSNIAYDTVVHH